MHLWLHNDSNIGLLVMSHCLLAGQRCSVSIIPGSGLDFHMSCAVELTRLCPSHVTGEEADRPSVAADPMRSESPAGTP